ncbi:hypothetical protein QBC41DRAFT_346440 [Cercophora samala]|uniref:Uncharacterized protein n=1 Tax=Cercophora samala TaxID=330535 RepID=A0AA40DAM2_9PEZI|nr:hypothetical protein QBC41DRAFT_346440 [Cercophora samala]
MESSIDLAARYTSFYSKPSHRERPVVRTEQLLDPNTPIPSIECEEDSIAYTSFRFGQSLHPETPILSTEYKADCISQTPRAGNFTKKVAFSQLDFSDSRSQPGAPQSYSQWTGGWGNGMDQVEAVAPKTRFSIPEQAVHDEGRKRKRIISTPYPRQNPQTGYIAPILLRDYDDDSSDDERSPEQHPAKRKRLDSTPGPKECVDTTMNTEEHQDDVLSRFSPLDLDENRLMTELSRLIDDHERRNETRAVFSSGSHSPSPLNQGNTESEGTFSYVSARSYQSTSPPYRPTSPSYPPAGSNCEPQSPEIPDFRSPTLDFCSPTLDQRAPTPGFRSPSYTPLSPIQYPESPRYIPLSPLQYPASPTFSPEP